LFLKSYNYQLIEKSENEDRDKFIVVIPREKESGSITINKGKLVCYVLIKK